MTRPAVTRIVALTAAAAVTCGATVALDDVRSPLWWAIRGVQGEFYPCKPDIFEVTYEVVEDGDR